MSPSKIVSASLLSFLSFLFFFCSSSEVFAQADSATESAQIITNTPINLTISPITIQLETDPGKSVQSQVKIRNNGTDTERIRLHVLPFEAQNGGDRPLLRDPRPDDSYLSWVTVPQTVIEIAPEEWKTVPFSFSPPETAALSYYFAVQIERTTTRSYPGETTVSGSPAVLVLTTVNSPHAKRELQLVNFDVRRRFVEFLPQTLEIQIQNTGNVHAVPSGNIFIDSQTKKDLAVLSLNPNSSNILPGSTRSFLVTWDDGFPRYVRDEKTEKETLQYDFSKADRLRIGRYTAHMLLVYDNGERDVPIESFVSFWVIPIRLIIALIAVPSLPALVVYIIMRWRMSLSKKKNESVNL